MKRVVLDSNIYISAIFFGGKPKDVLELARLKRVEIVISESILQEIREVLRRKFSVPDARLNTIEHDILSIAKTVAVSSVVDVIAIDLADNEILACALDGKAEAIITGDNHLLAVKRYQNIRIVTPNIFLKAER